MKGAVCGVTNTLSQFIQSDNYCCDELELLTICVHMRPCTASLISDVIRSIKENMNTDVKIVRTENRSSGIVRGFFGGIFLFLVFFLSRLVIS